MASISVHRLRSTKNPTCSDVCPIQLGTGCFCLTSRKLSGSYTPQSKTVLVDLIDLVPVHPSKASKVAGKRKGPQRQLNISPKVLSDSLLLSSGVDGAEPQPSPSPERVAPRRSKRIQPPVPTVSKDPTRTASTNPSKRAVRSKPVASSLTARVFFPPGDSASSRVTLFDRYESDQMDLRTSNFSAIFPMNLI
jgi:hypothetical protein